MDEYTTTDARKNFSECISKALKNKGVRIVNRSNKKESVVIISEEYYDRLVNEYKAKSDKSKFIRIDQEYKSINRRLNDIEEMLDLALAKKKRQ